MSKRDETEAVTEADWRELMADAEIILDEYEDAGWEVHSIDPDRVHVRDGDDGFGRGFEVIVLDDDFDAIYELVTERDVHFDGSEVYAARDGDTVRLVVVMVATDDDVVLAVPMAYGPAGSAMLEAAMEEGELRTFLRGPGDRSLMFAHDEPGIFRPH